MDPECIIDWSEALSLDLDEHQFAEYAKMMIRDGDHVAATRIIAKFQLHTQFNITEVIKSLVLVHNNVVSAMELVKSQVALHKQLVDILVKNDKVKEAVKVVKNFKLSP